LGQSLKTGLRRKLCCSFLSPQLAAVWPLTLENFHHQLEALLPSRKKSDKSTSFLLEGECRHLTDKSFFKINLYLTLVFISADTFSAFIQKVINLFSPWDISHL
jgi:hypothetical protein